jgi:hypothetical protein
MTCGSACLARAKTQCPPSSDGTQKPRQTCSVQLTGTDGARLVARFERAVTRELEHVLRSPERWPVVRERYRQKVFAGPFPYVLIYRVEAGAVFLVAVAHQRRRPGHWTSR